MGFGLSYDQMMIEAGADPSDMPDIRVWKDGVVKATRKGHSCEDCGCWLPVGSSARHIMGIEDRRFFSEYRHLTRQECEIAEAERMRDEDEAYAAFYAEAAATSPSEEERP